MISGIRSPAAPHVGSILREHLDELAFLNVQRRFLLFAPESSLSGLRRHEERVHAHQDALCIGASAAADLARERLGAPEPWDVFSAVWTWSALGSPTPAELLEAAAAADEEQLPSWGEAWRQLPADLFARILPESATDKAPAPVRAELVLARAWSGRSEARVLAAPAADGCARLRRNAARALGWATDEKAAILRLLDVLAADDEPEVVAVALWSAVLQGSRPAVDACRRAADGGTASAFQIHVLGLAGQAGDAAILAALLKDESMAPLAARALGWLGDVAAVPDLIGLLGSGVPPLVDAATEGLGRLLGELPEASEAEDAADGTPDPEFLRHWWQTACPLRDAGTPVLRGRTRAWSGAPADEPLESLWLRALAAREPALDWLRREVPDGFFRPDCEPEALPGV